ncbi:hypothetical protein KSP39_PZI016514 [Platanthera zijinensis]|uniref:Uncharacterized protein n=1 Tax=Platanthera zijinensis TaxID=2320716 RepID=A0AAP0G0P8_9ASPA
MAFVTMKTAEAGECYCECITFCKAAQPPLPSGHPTACPMPNEWPPGRSASSAQPLTPSGPEAAKRPPDYSSSSSLPAASGHLEFP